MAKAITIMYRHYALRDCAVRALLTLLLLQLHFVASTRAQTSPVISTFAGNGSIIESGAGGPATSAGLPHPRDLAIGPDGSCYLSRQNRIHRVTPHNTIETFVDVPLPTLYGISVGSQTAISGIAFDHAGNLIVMQSSSLGSRVVSFTPQKQMSILIDRGTLAFDIMALADGPLHGIATPPRGVASGSDVGVLVADPVNHRVIQRTSAGQLFRYAGANGTAGFAGDNGPAGAALLNRPSGLAVDRDGSLYIADSGNHCVRRVDSSRLISTVAGSCTKSGFGGDGALSVNARLHTPTGLAVDQAGNLYIADRGNNRIRRVDRQGIMQTVAGSGNTTNCFGEACFSGDGGPATSAQLSRWLDGLAVDSLGNLLIADRGNHRVRQVSGNTTSPSPITELPAIGTFAHLAVNAGWSTFLQIFNSGAIPAQAQIAFYGKDGNAASLPIRSSQIDLPPTSSHVSHLLASGGTLLIDAVDQPEELLITGSAKLKGNTSIQGFATFRSSHNEQEAVVPVESRSSKEFVLVYDNTDGYTTGVAIANTTGEQLMVAIYVLDDQGIQVASGNVDLAPHGQSSFSLQDRFPSTSNRMGTVRFSTTIGGQVAAVGLRFSPSGAFTTIPAMAAARTLGGGLAHLASGGGWVTTLALANLGDQEARARLDFRAGDGASLTLPIQSPQIGDIGRTAWFERTLAPRSLFVLRSGRDEEFLSIGWAELTGDEGISAFIIFSAVQSGQEAVVPLETRSAKSYVLAFDNTQSRITGAAIASLVENAQSVDVTIRDEAGAILDTKVLLMPARGHRSFALQVECPSTANRIGTAEFSPSSVGQINVLGLRFTPSGAFTSIPPFIK